MTPRINPPIHRTVVDASQPEAMGTRTMLVAGYAPARTRWPGLLAASVLGAGLAAFAISSFYDDRSLGTKIDAGVAVAQSKVQGQVTALRGAATDAAQDAAASTAMATNRVAGVLGDASITASVKTALAADPSLSAVKIDVKTREGVVILEGPAPDAKARERAQVLAAAPDGVVSVDNRLVVTAGS